MHGADSDSPRSRFLARRLGVGRGRFRAAADGHVVAALTLPGLESAAADRSAITLADHVDAICDVVTDARRPVVRVVHSGAGIPGYWATDRMPDQIEAMVYVDSAPATGPLRPDFAGRELPLPSIAWQGRRPLRYACR